MIIVRYLLLQIEFHWETLFVPHFCTAIAGKWITASGRIQSNFVRSGSHAIQSFPPRTGIPLALFLMVAIVAQLRIFRIIYMIDWMLQRQRQLIPNFWFNGVAFRRELDNEVAIHVTHFTLFSSKAASGMAFPMFSALTMISLSIFPCTTWARCVLCVMSMNDNVMEITWEEFLCQAAQSESPSWIPSTPLQLKFSCVDSSLLSLLSFIPFFLLRLAKWTEIVYFKWHSSDRIDGATKKNETAATILHRIFVAVGTVGVECIQLDVRSATDKYRLMPAHNNKNKV